MSSPIDLSIVVPVYGCVGCLEPLHDRLTHTLSGLEVNYEIIFVDDGSDDGAWALLTHMAMTDAAVRALKLSRNFGQHAAITAGLAQASGRWSVVMDCDLQHPPEEIPRLYATAQAGYDIVFTRRYGGGDTLFRRMMSRLYVRLMNVVMNTTINADFSNFSIVSRRVREAFLKIPDKERQYLMILYWLGFRHTTVEYEHAKRFAGKSTYTLASLVRFALAGLVFQTTTLLRWTIYVGFAVSLAGAGLAVFFVVNFFSIQHPYPGWTSLGVLLLMLGGFIILTLGVTGLYIGKIFTQVKDRPLFVIEAEIGAATRESEHLMPVQSGPARGGK